MKPEDVHLIVGAREMQALAAVTYTHRRPFTVGTRRVATQVPARPRRSHREDHKASKKTVFVLTI